MNTNTAFNKLLMICGDEVWIERTSTPQQTIWSIRWLDQHGETAANRIRLAAHHTDHHPTPGAAFNDWYAMGNHKALPTMINMPLALKEWIREIRC